MSRDQGRLELDRDLAEKMVELIATGKELLSDLVARMPIVEEFLLSSWF